MHCDYLIRSIYILIGKYVKIVIYKKNVFIPEKMVVMSWSDAAKTIFSINDDAFLGV